MPSHYENDINGALGQLASDILNPTPLQPGQALSSLDPASLTPLPTGGQAGGLGTVDVGDEYFRNKFGPDIPDAAPQALGDIYGNRVTPQLLDESGVTPQPLLGRVPPAPVVDPSTETFEQGQLRRIRDAAGVRGLVGGAGQFFKEAAGETRGFFGDVAPEIAGTLLGPDVRAAKERAATQAAATRTAELEAASKARRLVPGGAPGREGLAPAITAPEEKTVAEQLAAGPVATPGATYEAYTTEGPNRIAALKYADERKIKGKTDDERIRTAVDQRRTELDARKARRGTPRQRRDDYQAARERMVQSVFAAAKRKDGTGTVASRDFNRAMTNLSGLIDKFGGDVNLALTNPGQLKSLDPDAYNAISAGLGAGMMGATTQTGGANRLSAIASADPANLRTDGDRYAHQTASGLQNALTSAESFGKLPTNLRKQADRIATRLEGFQHGSLGGKGRKKFERDELAPFIESLKTHAASQQSGLSTAGKVADVQSKRAATQYRTWLQNYNDKKLLLSIAGGGKAASKRMGEKDLRTEMVRMQDEEGIVPFGKGGALTKFQTAVNKHGKDWESYAGGFNNLEKEYIRFYLRANKEAAK